MAWECLCWRDGGGLVISSLSLTADEAAFRGCRVFGGLPVVGQNDRGGLPQPWRFNGGLLTGEIMTEDVNKIDIRQTKGEQKHKYRGNMTKQDWLSLKELKDDDIIIKPSNKGGNVVMNRGKYIKESCSEDAEFMGQAEKMTLRFLVGGYSETVVLDARERTYKQKRDDLVVPKHGNVRAEKPTIRYIM
ncbi:hypothetical protein NDU88_001749 [Pleurodeles waltl]|uniref:Uncharacterized protein n=1 Tax=Pleurodeles waltl TaxID=8319 RepID=A0AAV7W1D8_PLEWA|nr:hypothetical protein NDU88_001749 [Pleurodeles waltl]